MPPHLFREAIETAHASLLHRSAQFKQDLTVEEEDGIYEIASHVPQTVFRYWSRAGVLQARLRFNFLEFEMRSRKRLQGFSLVLTKNLA